MRSSRIFRWRVSRTPRSGRVTRDDGETAMRRITSLAFASPYILRSRTTRELIRLFLRLGFTAFGGPAAHIALMKDEVVTRRHWLSEAEFLDLLGATNLIPGPNSTQMAIHIGLRRAGLKGSVIAGVCFIAPAAVIVFLLAWAYVRWGSLPQAGAVLYGVKPVIIAIVIYA